MLPTAIATMPIKVPLMAVALLSFSLGCSHCLGLLEVRLSTSPPPRLFILLAIYLGMLSGVTYIHLKILSSSKVSVSCSRKVNLDAFEREKKELTEQKVE